MRKLDRYIGITIFTTILLVILVLVGMELFIGFSKEFPDMGTGNYGISQATMVVFLLLPWNIYQFFPMAGLLGSLIGLGLMASRSELIVMRAAGVSLIKITWAVLKAAIVVLVIAVLLGEVIGPWARHEAATIKATAMSGGQAIYTRRGIWVRNHRDFIHIATVKPKSNSLQNITRYRFNAKAKLIEADLAKRAVYRDGQWTFHDIALTKFAANKVTSARQTEANWQMSFKPRLLGLVNVESSDRSLPQLHTYITYLKRSGLSTAQYAIDFWQRIFQPLATLVMILLAVPFIFGPLRTVTMGFRIVVGAVMGFGFFFLNQFMAPFSTVYQLSPLLVALMPIVLVAGLAFFLLLRAR